jgi:uncharacterized protein YoxC
MLKINMPRAFAYKLLHSKYMLYFVFFLSIIILFKHLIKYEINYIIIFVLIGFLTTFYSKNMIIILLTSIFVTFIISLKRNPEGMENKEADIDSLLNGEDVSNEDVERIHNQTKDLLQKQKALMDKVTQIEPILQKAEQMIDQFKTIKMEKMKNKKE